MKICPKCNKTYSDNTLNFCLDDGTVLTHDTSANIETPETVFIPSQKETQPNQPVGTAQTFNNQPRYQSNAGNSSSKMWLLAVLVIGGVILLCGGGLIGLVAIGSMADDEKPPKEITEKTSETPQSETLNKDNTVRSTDFSDMIFADNKFITADNSNGNLKLTSRKNYYYVFVMDKFRTQDRKIKLTVKNADNKKSSLGFGLVVQSHPKDILSKDYAFVIRSNKRQYRVVRHNNKRESVIVNWKRSSAIRSGSAENDLEVEIVGNKMKFYINGKFIRTVTDRTGFKDGVAGVYTSDDIPIVFSKLELRK